MSNKTLIIIIAILLIGGTALYFMAKPDTSDQAASVAGLTDGTDQSSQLTDGSQTNTNQTQTSMEKGTEAVKGDMVMVHYTGKLTNGTVFDSSIGRGEPFGFVLGAGMVIPGWEKGILGMKVGEKKTLTIAPEDAYGPQGVSNPATGEVIIPANATLVFDVELVDIKR